MERLKNEVEQEAIKVFFSSIQVSPELSATFDCQHASVEDTLNTALSTRTRPPTIPSPRMKTTLIVPLVRTCCV